MKKLVILAITILVLFAGFPSSYAKTYYRTFEVVEIQGDGVVLMDFEGGRFLVEKDPSKINGGLKVGDSVRYNSARNVLKKNPLQPAKITKMADRTITLQLRSGEMVDVNIEKDSSTIKGGLKVGDSVSYDYLKNMFKKDPWQPAKITEVTDRTITLQLNSGEMVDVNMRSKYSKDLNKGDQVHYNASKGQIRKSNLMELEED